MHVNIEFDGETYSLDLDEVDVGEARTIKRQTGMNLVDLNRGALIDADPDALVAVYWLMQKQNGKPAVDMNRVNFKVAKFATALLNAHEEAMKELAEKEKDDPKEESAETDPQT